MCTHEKSRVYVELGLRDTKGLETQRAFEFLVVQHSGAAVQFQQALLIEGSSSRGSNSGILSVKADEEPTSKYSKVLGFTTRA